MKRSTNAGFTLLELLVAIAVLAMISTLIYSAFAGMRSSKEGIERLNDRHHEGREAMRRLTRELQSAYISKHRPADTGAMVVNTAFVGKRGTPADRIDFNSFSSRRYDRDSHVSDQCELSYYGARDPKNPDVLDLVRRIDAYPDIEPDKGGRVDVVATDIDLFDLEYLDALTGLWAEEWDSTQATDQPDRLPIQVRITLVLNGGRRKATERAHDMLKYVTKVAIPMNHPLAFAIDQ